MKEKGSYRCVGFMVRETLKKIKIILTIWILFAVMPAVYSPVAVAQEKPETQLYLVSLGTGDPDNITLRALNTIQKSSVIFCMDRVAVQFPGLLDGKEIHRGTLSVHKAFMRSDGDRREGLEEVKEISRIIRKSVGEGKTVSILDYGDPTIYGPNMWFMEVFEDLNPEIVPGVSSFNVANAALKKGVTWGEKTRSVILNNGTDVEQLAAARAAMVFFTMREDVPGIVGKLKGHYPSETPVAVVSNAGFRDKERIIQGTLATIEEKIKGEKLSLYLFYVGDFLTKRYGIDAEKEPSGRSKEFKCGK